MQRYFQEKSDAMSGRKEGTEDDQRDLLPGFYVDSGFFQNIFGGGDIELIPQGSVALDLGILYSKRDNPAFSPRNRSTFTFDFDQRIQLSLLGNIGERLKVTANYDTESTFDFQNQLKLEYTPTEDDIIQKIEVGNINMPLNSALIQGAQSLFGLKTQLQFGKTTITGVFSEQKSERRTVNVEGGATVQEFEKFAIEYDENRHFFLAHSRTTKPMPTSRPPNSCIGEVTRWSVSTSRPCSSSACFSASSISSGWPLSSLPWSLIRGVSVPGYKNASERRGGDEL
jgi:cell surface protein SprA